jgi:hypothetical protein
MSPNIVLLLLWEAADPPVVSETTLAGPRYSAVSAAVIPDVLALGEAFPDVLALGEA